MKIRLYSVLLKAIAVAVVLACTGISMPSLLADVAPKVVQTKYPSSDIVIATRNVVDYGAKGDGTADNTEAFRKALEQAERDGGGVVFVPAGRFVIRGNLSIPSGVTLRGDWNSPEDSSVQGIGTLLLVYAGRNEPKGRPFLTLQPSSGLKNLSIWYPEQRFDNIVPYPPTIKQAPGQSMTVEYVTLFNPYWAIDIGPDRNELHLIRHVFGTPLRTGISRDATTDVGRLQCIRFQPKYWGRSGLPGAPASRAEEEVLRSWLAENGKGIVAAYPNWLFFYDITLEGYHVGLQFNPSTARQKRGPNGGIYKLQIFGGETGIVLGDTNPIGISIVNAVISASRGANPTAIRTQETFKSVAQFNTVQIGTATEAGVLLDSPEGFLSFLNCTFGSTAETAAFAIDVHRGSVEVAQSTFRQPSNHLRLTEGTRAAAVLGNQFNGVPSILQETQSPKADKKRFLIDHGPVDLARFKAPEQFFERPLPHSVSSQLFNARSFGAVGDGVRDDTPAIQSALTMARTTGGTVYLPPGQYLLQGELRVPTGVELRGSFEVQHHTAGPEGTQLIVLAGKGNPDGPALIQLEQRSGLRGITVYYPEQVWKTTDFIPYPWTIQSLGPEAWVKDVVLVNPYQGIDFGTHDNTGHYIDYVSGSPLKRGIFVGNNSGTGWVQNIQFIPHYWGRSAYGNRPDDGGPTLRLNTIQTLDALVFGYNAAEQVLHTFVYGTNSGIRFVRQEGKGVTSGFVLGHGTDGAETSMLIDDLGKVDFVNAQLVAMTSKNDKRHIVIGPEVSGEARFFTPMFWGRQVNRSTEVAGGRVVIQQASYTHKGEAAVYATGGQITINGCYFQEPGRAVYLGPELKRATLTGNVFAIGAPDETRFENHAPDRARVLKNIGGVKK